MSSYACEPDRGSEPSVGWNWAMAMSEHADVTVLTRANNQGVIGKKIEALEKHGRKNFPMFIYHDPPHLVIKAKKRGLLPVQLFYIIWQMGAFFKMKKTLCDYEIVHHVTFNSMMFPGLWWSNKTTVVLGPLGGTSCVKEDYKVLFGRGAWKEKLREFMISHWSKLPWLRMSFNRASLILCANSETEALLSTHYPNKVVRILEAGLDDAETVSENIEVHSSNLVRFIWVGSVEPWKALSLALRAFSKAIAVLPDGLQVELDVVGKGSELEKAKAEACELGIAKKVKFHGALSLIKTQAIMVAADVLIFSSIKDTSGNVVLEAMGKAKPVICLDHQGVKDIVTPQTGIKVKTGELDATIVGISEAIVGLALDFEKRLEMGKEGRDRIKALYLWREKAKTLKEHYNQITKMN